MKYIAISKIKIFVNINVYKQPFTNEAKLYWFLYHINHCVLGTNKLLYKINIKNNPYVLFARKNLRQLNFYFGIAIK